MSQDVRAYHLQEGGTLNDNILLQLNGCLRQIGRRSLTFVNGHTTNYAYVRGQEKVTLRQQILDRLRGLNPEDLADLIARKESEASRLPERDADLPNRSPPTIDSLSRAEIERRRAALAAAQKAETKRDSPAGNEKPPAPTPAAGTPREDTNDYDREFIPESTVQDNVVELIAEMHDLRTEVGPLKTMLQAVFRNI